MQAVTAKMKSTPKGLWLFAFLTIFTMIGVSRPAEGRGRPILLHLGPQVWLSNSTALGVNASFSTRIHDQHPLFLGADMGVMFYPSPFSMSLPILPSIYYKFPNQSQVTPIIGMSAGLVITVGTVNTANFGFFFKPGIEMKWNSSSNLFVEMRLGAIGSAFVFNPVVGLSFPL